MILDKLKEVIKNSEFDAILLSGLENPTAARNLYYITKYTGSYGFAVIGKDYQYFLSDFRYRDQVKKEVPDYKYIEIEGSLIETINKVIDIEKIKNLGFDKKIRYSDFELFSTLNCELIPMDNVIEKFRISKTDDEIKLIKKACEITDQALEYVLGIVKPGMVERDIEVILKNKMIELGAESTWERFVVASGHRGAMPHGMASDKVIQEGELVTFDIGCFYQGYSSDMTRTVAMGEVSQELKNIYAIVLEAQKRGVAAAKAGITGKALDSVCRDYITNAGFGDYFKHGTGHGLGLDVHEAPRVSQAYDLPLELGACVTIEPGIYITGLGGVRIEDDVILTEGGCIILNEFPKELITIK
ncbi:MAG: aminopeptidase P family protein [Candidatus Izimaplasma sp.]|nr:aminopeptidase P family protein [Candidatus Izimaplasma bacterium]